MIWVSLRKVLIFSDDVSLFPFLTSNMGEKHIELVGAAVPESWRERTQGHREKSIKSEQSCWQSPNEDNQEWENKKLGGQLVQSCPGWGPPGPCISGQEESNSWCLEHTISLSLDWLILQSLMKLFNTAWAKGQKRWQLSPEMQISVMIELDLPSAIIQTLYGIEWETFQVWKRKENLREFGSRNTGVSWGNLFFYYWLSQKQAVLESSWESLCLCDSSLISTRKRGQKFIRSLTSIWTFQCWAELNL